MRSRVAAAVALIVSFSTEVIVGVVVPPVNVAVKVSVPEPALNTSVEFKVARFPPEPPKEPSNESLPAVPEKVFALVVSVNIRYLKKVITIAQPLE
jgi:hypothetical protein